MSTEPGSSGAMRIGVLGGTGPQGRGLALRLAVAGHRIAIGSRDGERAASCAAELAAVRPGLDVTGLGNAGAAEHSELVIVAVPWAGHAELLTGLGSELAGKIVVDCVNPLGFDERGAHRLEVAEGSAAEQAAALLPGSRVVAAFHHVSAVLLLDPALADVDTDVLVLGDDRDATDAVQALAAQIPGIRGVYGGRLRNAGQVETLTANLIEVNRRYKTHAGIRVTGL
ncbi:MAG TPA: NADPH-dependent F420 reductase [Mycobacteriales bacterium]|nr:NADPH-dependent F420 reductase [Mycobacteriales bacterium]